MRPCLILLLFIFMESMVPVVAQTSMASIHESGMGVVESVQELGQQIVHIEFDVLSTDISYKSIFRSLSSDLTYKVGVLGGEGIKDIDLTLYKLNGDKWTLIQSADTDENFAVTEGFVPDAELYKIVVIVDEFDPGSLGGYFSLMVSYDSDPVDVAGPRYKIITTTTSHGYFTIETEQERTTSTEDEFNTWTIYQDSRGAYNQFQQRAGRVPFMFDITEELENSGEDNILRYTAKDEDGKLCLLFLNKTKKTITHYYSNGVNGQLGFHRYTYNSILDLQADD